MLFADKHGRQATLLAERAAKIETTHYRSPVKLQLIDSTNSFGVEMLRIEIFNLLQNRCVQLFLFGFLCLLRWRLEGTLISGCPCVIIY